MNTHFATSNGSFQVDWVTPDPFGQHFGSSYTASKKQSVEIGIERIHTSHSLRFDEIRRSCIAAFAKQNHLAVIDHVMDMVSTESLMIHAMSRCSGQEETSFDEKRLFCRDDVQMLRIAAEEADDHYAKVLAWVLRENLLKQGLANMDDAGQSHLPWL